MHERCKGEVIIMKKYVIEFLKRGMAFAGFGPVVAGVIYLILSYSIEDFTLSGLQVFVAIISTYLLAFIQAGASIFNQIESFSVPKSMACHLSLIYVAYVGCYLLNSWIPFNWMAILIFTGIFLVTYLVIWFVVYFSVKATSKNFNKGLI